MSFFGNEHLPLMLATLVLLIALYCTFAKIKEVEACVQRQVGPLPDKVEGPPPQGPQSPVQQPDATPPPQQMPEQGTPESLQHPATV